LIFLEGTRKSHEVPLITRCPSPKVYEKGCPAGENDGIRGNQRKLKGPGGVGLISTGGHEGEKRRRELKKGVKKGRDKGNCPAGSSILNRRGK